MSNKLIRSGIKTELTAKLSGEIYDFSLWSILTCHTKCMIGNDLYGI